MDVRGEEHPRLGFPRKEFGDHGPPSTSSGSSYQRLRSPILARIFQPNVLGSSSMRSCNALDALGDALLALLGQVVAVHVPIEGFEVGREGAPQAPVGGAQAWRSGQRLPPRRPLPRRVVVQEGEGVADVLLVELDDLELREQELGQRDRERLQGHTLAEGYLVAHPEGADQDVDLPVVLLVEVKQALPAVHRVEPRLRNVSQGLEELLRLREDLPLGMIQSRSAYSRSKAGCRPSFARTFMATPPSRRRATSSGSASSATRTASSTTSDRVPLILLPPLSPYFFFKPGCPSCA